jgi:serine/threonine-protein kinase
VPETRSRPPGIAPSGGDETFPTVSDDDVWEAPSALVPEPVPSAAGADDYVTIVDPDGPPGALDLTAEAGGLATHDFVERYELGEGLGRGGMGDVRLARDRRIGRTVALKLIRADGAKRPRMRARFLFEARMQGQLEHPSIVPVYDLGVRDDGTEFFTMRRVRGRTLQEVIRGHRAGDRVIQLGFSRRRLLAAFQSVCLAVEFAHQRGVVHRDLKPANIMLGEFGEVIVLDWGLAKLKDPGAFPAPDRAGIRDHAIDTTAVGEVLGSPGYMSPEQAVDSGGVGPATDVFALGAILFEILTLRRLIEGDTPARIASKTRLGEFDAHIAKRFPELEVPPELEAICVKATDDDPARRQPRARDLADAVASYLEGDRDVARRRSMATKHGQAAMEAFAESVAAQAPEAAKASRSRAIREVNHALAIDPSSQTALRTMMRIITEAPTAVAPEAEAAIRASEERALRKVAQRGTFAYLALASTIGVMGLLGVVDGVALGVAVGSFLVAAAITMLSTQVQLDPAPLRGPRLTVGGMILAVILVSSCGIAASSMLFGPLVYVPSLAGANVVVFAAGVGRRYRYFALVCGIAAILAPLALDLAGVLPAGWIFKDGAIVIVPRAVMFPGPSALALLTLASLGTVLFPVLLVGAERDARVKAERELVQKERALAEFVPVEAGEAITGVRRSIPPTPPSNP